MKTHEKLLILVQKERQITSEILSTLQIMENKRGYLKMGHSSLFDYLVRGLGYSESTAYQRQSCLRLSRELPEIKEKIDSGSLSLTTVTMAYRSIKNKTTAEKRLVLKSIENKSSREVKKILLEPAQAIQIKKTIYKDKVILRLELSHEQYQKLEKLKALKSHKTNMESLLDNLIAKELKAYEVKKLKEVTSKNPRYISRRLRNAVLNKAEYKCQHPGCTQTHYLQIDHIWPVSKGGKALEKNLQALCGAHNRHKG